MISTIDKAIVAFLTPIVLSGLAAIGIVPEMTVGEAIPLIIGAAVTAAVVWAVPNRKT